MGNIVVNYPIYKMVADTSCKACENCKKLLVLEATMCPNCGGQTFFIPEKVAPLREQSWGAIIYTLIMRALTILFVGGLLLAVGWGAFKLVTQALGSVLPTR